MHPMRITCLCVFAYLRGQDRQPGLGRETARQEEEEKKKTWKGASYTCTDQIRRGKHGVEGIAPNIPTIIIHLPTTQPPTVHSTQYALCSSAQDLLDVARLELGQMLEHPGYLGDLRTKDPDPEDDHERGDESRGGLQRFQITVPHRRERHDGEVDGVVPADERGALHVRVVTPRTG